MNYNSKNEVGRKWRNSFICDLIYYKDKNINLKQVL